MKKFIIVLLAITISSFFSINVYAFNVLSNNDLYTNNETETEISDVSIVENTYSQQLDSWEAMGLSSQIAFHETISPLDFSFSTNGRLTTETNEYDDFEKQTFDENGFILTFDEESDESFLSFDVSVVTTGLYTLSFDYYSLTDTINAVNMEILVNDEIQYYESSQIVLNTLWTTPTEFLSDRYGNDTMPSASQSYQWIYTYIKDAARVQPEPLLFKLDSGVNTITFNLNEGLLMFGQIYIGPQISYISYDEYVTSINHEMASNSEYIFMEAENPSLKNTVSIRYGTDKEPAVTPFGITENKLNIIDGDS
ncbi:MAG: hypothetical protein WCR19_06150, partial [Acholeplasmataceae bacterium]